MKHVLVVKQQKEIAYKTFSSVMEVSKKEAALIKKHQKNKSMTNVERGRYHKLLDRLGEAFFESNYKEEKQTDWDEGLIEEIVSLEFVKQSAETTEEKKPKASKKELKKLEKERKRQEKLSKELAEAESQQVSDPGTDGDFEGESVPEYGT